MPELNYVVAEPRSIWRRQVLRFELFGGTAEERFIVITNMKNAFGERFLVRAFPTPEYRPAVQSIWPRRAVRDIIIPVLNFLTPFGGVTDGEAAERRARIRRVEDGA